MVESAGLVTVCVIADRGDGSEIYTFTLISFNITTQGTYMCVHFAAGSKCA